MKIFPKRSMPTDVRIIFETTQMHLKAVTDANPQQLVAVKSRMGGYEMELQEVPRGQEFMLVR